MKKLVLIVILLACVSLFAEHSFKKNIENKIDAIEISAEMKVFFISMVPIFELRGAIPIGIHHYKLPYWKVISLAIFGNMIPIFFILLFFELITKICFKVPIFKKILETIFARTRRKSAIIEKYEEIGLMFFVAIPLPITGAWTGSLAAYLMGLNFWKSILFIFLGVLIAAGVVTFLTSLKWIGLAVAVSAIVLLSIRGIFKKKSNKI